MRTTPALCVLALLTSVSPLPAAAPPLAKRELLPLAHPASGTVLDGRLHVLRVYRQSVTRREAVVPGDFSYPDLVALPLSSRGGERGQRFRLDKAVDTDTWCRW